VAKIPRGRAVDDHVFAELGNRAMKSRTAARLAWLLWAVVVPLTIAVAVAGVVGAGELDAVLVAFVTFVLAFSTVGALVASRLPHNPIGWIMSGAALAYVVGGASLVYVEEVGHGVPVTLAGRLVIWLGTWVFSIGLGLAGIFLLLLFPSGRPPSPRWRIVGYAGALGILLLVVGIAFVPGSFEGHGVNPLGVRGAASFLHSVEDIGGTLTIAAVAGAAASLIVRFRRSKGVERQQLKWLAYAGAVVALGFVAIVPVEAVFGSTKADDINNFVITQTLALVPIATGIAVLRYRLYDIDRIINRTIVYLLVTGSLVAVYAGTVFVISAVAVGSSDNLTVAVATLVAAALFRPALRRVQGFVDRRFYRFKYDAQQTIDAFGYRLREETNLDELTSDLLGVVRQTVQPAHASVWLQPSDERPTTASSTHRGPAA
jgi:hypothetical protein